MTPEGDEDAKVSPEDVGLGRATRTDIPWNGEEAEAESLLAALSGEDGPVLDLILYNAALRLWLADEATPLRKHVDRARDAVSSGAATALLDRMRR